MSQIELIDTRLLLEDPKRWTKGMSARDKDGILRGAHDDDAVCWCLYGAMYKCGVQGDEWDLVEAVIRREYEYPGIPSFNDDERTTHEMVLRVLDLAIKESAPPIDDEYRDRRLTEFQPL